MAVTGLGPNLHLHLDLDLGCSTANMQAPEVASPVWPRCCGRYLRLPPLVVVLVVAALIRRQSGMTAAAAGVVAVAAEVMAAARMHLTARQEPWPAAVAARLSYPAARVQAPHYYCCGVFMMVPAQRHIIITTITKLVTIAMLPLMDTALQPQLQLVAQWTPMRMHPQQQQGEQHRGRVISGASLEP